ncbi:hypothetical protein GOV06_02615 [Candidatus Woesearchaeota archaeon]|nr:hypothetical protein [Candidatus Woesearchaeota archaeon]
MSEKTHFIDQQSIDLLLNNQNFDEAPVHRPETLHYEVPVQEVSREESAKIVRRVERNLDNYFKVEIQGKIYAMVSPTFLKLYDNEKSRKDFEEQQKQTTADVELDPSQYEYVGTSGTILRPKD